MASRHVKYQGFMTFPVPPGYTLIEVSSYGVFLIPSKKNNAKSLKRAIAREVAVQSAGLYVGEDLARLGYRAGAKAIRATNSLAPVRPILMKAKKKARKKINQVGRSVKMKMFSQPTNKGLVLSDPARLYLKSFMDPFDSTVKAVGTPRPGSMPSYKVTGFLRGVAAIGQNGFGYVAFAPCLCNDKFSVIYSTSAYQQTLVSQIPNDGLYSPSAFSPAAVSMTNLPFNFTTLTTTTTSANASSAVEGRIVSASLRVYYTGTTLNQSGQYYGYADPDLESVVGGTHASGAAQTVGYTAADLGAKDACEIKGADRQGIHVVAIPNNNNTVDYPNNGASSLRKAFPFSNGLTQGLASENIGAAPLVICVTGVKEQTFYFEAITHAEYIGPGVPQALLTQSFADTVGYDSVQMILNRAQRRCASDPRKSFKQCLMAEAAAEGVRL